MHLPKIFYLISDDKKAFRLDFINTQKKAADHTSIKIVM